MIDELLGRAELKARIEELEDRNERLQRRLDAEEERRADAVTARQDAEERANRLEDRIAELRDRVERLDGDEPDLDFRGTEALRGGRLEEVLDRLRSVETGPEGALTAMVGDGNDLPEAVRDACGDHAALVRRAAPCLAYADDAGLVSAALAPPLPPEPFCEWDDRFRVEESWFRPVGTFGFALVRSDLFAYGAYDGDERIAFEGFESDVKEKHSKGGFSQARFERIRDGQIADHVEKCREALEARDDDRLVVVGDREIARELRDLADQICAVDASGAPEDALDEAFREFWTTRLSLI
jgi:peptide subunit release factor 1 (eRF1)